MTFFFNDTVPESLSYILLINASGRARNSQFKMMSRVYCSFKERSAHLSAVMKEKTPSPVQTAVFWIEHVIKHGGDHLRPASAGRLSFWEYMLLDVLALVALCLAVCIKVVLYALRIISRKVTTKLG